MRGLPLMARLSVGLRAAARAGPGRRCRGRGRGRGRRGDALAAGDEVYGELGLAGGGSPSTPCSTRPCWSRSRRRCRSSRRPPCRWRAGTRHWSVCARLRRLRGWRQRLLVNGACGGVGTFAVQLGRALWARRSPGCARTGNVDPSVSTHSAPSMSSTTSRDDVAGLGSTSTCMLDLVGNRSLRGPAPASSRPAACWCCRVAAARPASGRSSARPGSCSGARFRRRFLKLAVSVPQYCRPDAAQLRRPGRAGRGRDPRPGRRPEQLPLAEAAAAMTYLETEARARQRSCSTVSSSASSTASTPSLQMIITGGPPAAAPGRAADRGHPRRPG